MNEKNTSATNAVEKKKAPLLCSMPQTVLSLKWTGNPGIANKAQEHQEASLAMDLLNNYIPLHLTL